MVGRRLLADPRRRADPARRLGTITAMLYKIVPSSPGCTLTQAGPGRRTCRPTPRSAASCACGTTSLATLCVAVFVPMLALLAGVVLAVEFGWLFANLLRVVRARRDAAKTPGPEATPARDSRFFMTREFCFDEQKGICIVRGSRV